MNTEDRNALISFILLLANPIIYAFTEYSGQWSITIGFFLFIIFMACFDQTFNPHLYDIRLTEVGDKDETINTIINCFEDIRYRVNHDDVEEAVNSFPKTFYAEVDDYKIKKIKKQIEKIQGNKCEIIESKPRHKDVFLEIP